MRRNLMLRFIAAYLLTATVIRVLAGSSWIILRQIGILQVDGVPDMMGTARELLANIGQNFASILISNFDLGMLADTIVSACVLAAGAVLFARGPARRYDGLCERAEKLAPEASGGGAGRNSAAAMERRLDGIAARLAAAESAEKAFRANGQQAAGLLDAARTQLEVLVEAGALAEGSAEAALMRDVLDKIEKAETQLIR